MQYLVITCQETFTAVEFRTVTIKIGASLGTAKRNQIIFFPLMCQNMTNNDYSSKIMFVQVLNKLLRNYIWCYLRESQITWYTGGDDSKKSNTICSFKTDITVCNISLNQVTSGEKQLHQTITRSIQCMSQSPVMFLWYICSFSS